MVLSHVWCGIFATPRTGSSRSSAGQGVFAVSWRHDGSTDEGDGDDNSCSTRESLPFHKELPPTANDTIAPVLTCTTRLLSRDDQIKQRRRVEC